MRRDVSGGSTSLKETETSPVEVREAADVAASPRKRSFRAPTRFRITQAGPDEDPVSDETDNDLFDRRRSASMVEIRMALERDAWGAPLLRNHGDENLPTSGGRMSVSMVEIGVAVARVWWRRRGKRLSSVGHLCLNQFLGPHYNWKGKIRFPIGNEPMFRITFTA